MATKWVYLFGEVKEAEEKAGSWDGVRALLGGKGANLAEMTRIGVPVPPGGGDALRQYQFGGDTLPTYAKLFIVKKTAVRTAR
mgnify:CR=1 FL=1